MITKKFKGWVVSESRWLKAGSFPFNISSPDKLELAETNHELDENMIWSLGDQEDIIWCQSTGWKDSEGREVYEGNIIESCSEYYLIVWVEDTSSFQCLHIQEETLIAMKDVTRHEFYVFGHILEIDNEI